MNINDFTQCPQAGKTYARNEVPPFVIVTTSVIGVELSTNGVTVFSGKYAPDFGGVVSIDFSGIYDRYLETRLPEKGRTEIVQTAYRRLFTASFRVINGEVTSEEPPTVSWYVANAECRTEDGFEVWSRTAFLTGQPEEKPVCHDAPEWLTWFDLEGGTSLKVRFYRKINGKPLGDVAVSPGIPSPGCRSVAVDYSRLVRLANVVPSQLLPYYDLVLCDANDQELTLQRYVYCDRTGQEKYYCFVNSLGGIDTLTCRGENTLQPDVTHNIGRFNKSGSAFGDYSALDDAEDVMQWKQSTGRIPFLWRDWLAGLFVAKRGSAFYIPADKEYLEIVVKSSDLGMGDSGQLSSASFTYIVSEADHIATTAGQKTTEHFHQSAVEAAGDLLDETVERSLRFRKGVTETVVITSERLWVNLSGFLPGTDLSYTVDGELAGEIHVESGATQEVLTIPYGASVGFVSKTIPDISLEIVYYEGFRINEFYRAAWTSAVCVTKRRPYTFAWSSHVCVQVEAPYTFGWSEAVCASIPVKHPYSFVWSESVCARQYSYILTWEDF